jgi:hypothetical protein
MSLSRQQLTLLGIFALFMGPVLLVMMMRSSWWQYQPSGMKNQGLLVQPPVHLSLDQTNAYEGKWLILYVLEQPCDEVCIENITAIRQIHRAAGRKSEHLAIVLLGESLIEPALQARLKAIYPMFNFVVDANQKLVGVINTIKTDIQTDSPADSTNIRTYILDPMQNVVLAYPSSADPTDLHKDLKRLLKWADQENK